MSRQVLSLDVLMNGECIVGTSNSRILISIGPSVDAVGFRRVYGLHFSNPPMFLNVQPRAMHFHAGRDPMVAMLTQFKPSEVKRWAIKENDNDLNPFLCTKHRQAKAPTQTLAIHRETTISLFQNEVHLQHPRPPRGTHQQPRPCRPEP